MNKIKKNKIDIELISIILILLFIFVTIRGFSSYLNQEKLKLEKEKHSIGTINEWIKYEINDKISLNKIDILVREKLGMREVKQKDTIIIKIKKQIQENDLDKNKNEKSFLKTIKKLIKKTFGIEK